MSVRMSWSERERATKHWRTSPGGRTPSSSRRMPVEPPLSDIATTAESSRGYFLRPESTVKVPVQPPTTTTFFMVYVVYCIRITRLKRYKHECGRRQTKELSGYV